MADYSRTASSERFKFGGLKTNSSPDSMESHKFPFVENLRGYSESSTQSRPQIVEQVAVPFGGSTSVLSLEPDIGIYKQGTKIQQFSNGVVVDTGYASGKGCSIRPFRPNSTPNAWDYVFDDNQNQKIYITPGGVPTVQKVGIAEPQNAPDACPDHMNVAGVNVAVWTNAGTMLAPTAAGRTGGTVSAVFADPASVSPSLATRYSIVVDNQDYSIGMLIAIVLTSGGSLSAVIQDVFPAINPAATLTVQSIFYDSGVTGTCVIVPAQMPVSGSLPTSAQTSQADSIFNESFIASLRRGSVITIGAEKVFVRSVTVGPQGNISIQASTTVNHVAGEVITGNLALAISFTENPVLIVGQAISSTQFVAGIGAGIGLAFSALATNPFTAVPFTSNPALPTSQQDDYIHMSIFVDDPTKFTEVKIIFDVNNGAMTFQDNAYFRTVRINDIQPGISNTLTQLGVAQLVAQRAIIDEHAQAEAGTGTQVQSSLQSAAGVRQWSEVKFPISSLTRIGTDKTRTLANCQGVELSFNVSGGTSVAWSSLWVGNGQDPDVGDTGNPVFYRVRPRSAVTGVKGNPSPATRYGVSPRRQQVIVSLPSLAYDSQIDTADIERTGATLTDWRYVGSTQSSNTTYTDTLFDSAIENNLTDDFDNLEPFPSIGPPITAITEGGSPANIITGTIMQARFPLDLPISGILNSSAATLSQLGNLLPGNLFNIGQQVFTLRKRPTLISTDQISQYYLFEFEENAGSQTNPLILLQEPTLAAQPTNNAWGPDAYGVFFSVQAGTVHNNGSVGLRPGLVQWTNPNNPDGASDKNTKDLCPPTEPLINGELLGPTPVVASSRRWWRGFSNNQGGYSWNEIPVGAALAAEFGICSDGEAVYFVAKDGICRHAGGPRQSLTDQDLYNLFPHEGIFPINVTPYSGKTIFAPEYKYAANMRLGVVNGFLYYDYLDSVQTQRTLVCNLKTGAWVQDDYSNISRVSIHAPSGAAASNFLIPASASRNQQLFMGGVNGAIYVEQSSPTPASGETISCSLVTREEMFGDLRANKMFGDGILDALAAGSNITVTPTFLGSLFGTTTTVTGGQSSRPTSPPTIDISGEQLKRSMGLSLAWTDKGTTTILYLWQLSYFTQPEDISNRFTDWNNCGTEGNKFIQGFEIEADTLNVAKSFFVRSSDDLSSVQSFKSATGSNTITANGQRVVACSFDTPFSSHLVRIEPQDSNVWRLWKVKWIYQSTPESAVTWATQATAFGFNGYLHMKEMLAAYVSAATITLTITAFDGLSPSVLTLPSTGGTYRKVLFPCTPNKGLLYKFSAVSTAPFQIFESDCEILIRAWGSNESYTRYRGFGGDKGDGAKI